MTARADGVVERGRMVEAADVSEAGGRLLSENWSRDQGKDEDECACHGYSWLIATVSVCMADHLDKYGSGRLAALPIENVS